jgi:hypothetical protein
MKTLFQKGTLRIAVALTRERSVVSSKKRFADLHCVHQPHL